MLNTLTDFCKKIFNVRQLIVLSLGFASGFPLLLTGSTFKLWLAQDGVDIKTIGLMSLVGTAYSLKFFWAPLIDRYYFSYFGRRKTWIFISQVFLAIGLFMMSSLNPLTDGLGLLAGWAVFVAFMSATQDTAIDAYRREYLSLEELGLGSSMNVYGYRIAMLVAGGFLVSLVSDTSAVAAASTTGLTGIISWNQFYQISSLIMVVLAAITFFIPEPKSEAAPKTLFGAFLEPFKEFFMRKEALFVLLFVFLFKLGDQISGSLLTPFYKSMGYTNVEIGLITKTYGLFSTLAGLFVGGIALLKFGIRKCLWTFGILQALSTASFAIVTLTGPVIWSLSFAVIFEDFSSGMGTAAFTAYIASVTNTRFTATQFALLTSFATLGRTLFSGGSGFLQDAVGWAEFFYAGALLALPGLFVLWLMNKKYPIPINNLHT